MRPRRSGAPGADAARLGALIVGLRRVLRAALRARPRGTKQGSGATADTHRIAGLQRRVGPVFRVRLIRPSGDLLNMLALPDMAPFPESAFDPATGAISWLQAPSLGPYVRTPAPTASLTFARNTRWDATQDPLRRACVDRVVVSDPAPGRGRRRRGRLGRGRCAARRRHVRPPVAAERVPVAAVDAAGTCSRRLVADRGSPGPCTTRWPTRRTHGRCRSPWTAALVAASGGWPHPGRSRRQPADRNPLPPGGRSARQPWPALAGSGAPVGLRPAEPGAVSAAARSPTRRRHRRRRRPGRSPRGLAPGLVHARRRRRSRGAARAPAGVAGVGRTLAGSAARSPRPPSPARRTPALRALLAALSPPPWPRRGHHAAPGQRRRRPTWRWCG